MTEYSTLSIWEDLLKAIRAGLVKSVHRLARSGEITFVSQLIEESLLRSSKQPVDRVRKFFLNQSHLRNKYSVVENATTKTVLVSQYSESTQEAKTTLVGKAESIQFTIISGNLKSILNGVEKYLKEMGTLVLGAEIIKAGT
jgi:hypothetical protein